MDDFDYDYDYEEEFPINSFVEAEHSVQTVYEHCIIPSVASIIPNICDLIMYNLLFNVITQSGMPNYFFNLSLYVVPNLLF